MKRSTPVVGFHVIEPPARHDFASLFPTYAMSAAHAKRSARRCHGSVDPTFSSRTFRRVDAARACRPTLLRYAERSRMSRASHSPTARLIWGRSSDIAPTAGAVSVSPGVALRRRRNEMDAMACPVAAGLRRRRSGRGRLLLSSTRATAPCSWYRLRYRRVNARSPSKLWACRIGRACRVYKQRRRAEETSPPEIPNAPHSVRRRRFWRFVGNRGTIHDRGRYAW